MLVHGALVLNLGGRPCAGSVGREMNDFRVGESFGNGPLHALIGPLLIVGEQGETVHIVGNDMHWVAVGKFDRLNGVACGACWHKMGAGLQQPQHVDQNSDGRDEGSCFVGHTQPECIPSGPSGSRHPAWLPIEQHKGYDSCSCRHHYWELLGGLGDRTFFVGWVEERLGAVEAAWAFFCALDNFHVVGAGFEEG